MAHDHEVKVTGAIFEVEPITRKVTSGEEKKLVSGDHESTRFGFRMPRYINGHDMSLCQEVSIHTINVSKDNKMMVEDIYAVDDFGTDPEDEESVIWTWLVKRSATTHEGHTGFGLCFRCLTDGAIDYDWNTELCDKEIIVGKGQHNEEVIDETYLSFMEQWWEKLMSTGGATADQAEKIEKNKEDIGQLSDKINGGEIKGYNSHTYFPRTPKFENKYASFYGDSITLGSVLVDKYHSWPALFWKIVYPDDNRSYNVAVGGSMYCSDGQHTSIISQIINESSDFKNNSRTFFVAGGVNDWVLGTPLEDFRNAVQECFDYIEANLTGEVIWITPIRYNQCETNWRDCIAPLQKYREIIAEVVMSNVATATNTHFVIDGRDIGFPCYGSELSDLLFQDTGHPNQNGIDLIYVPGLVRIFDSYFKRKEIAQLRDMIDNLAKAIT